jgi:hypothetical protein
MSRYVPQFFVCYFFINVYYQCVFDGFTAACHFPSAFRFYSADLARYFMEKIIEDRMGIYFPGYECSSGSGEDCGGSGSGGGGSGGGDEDSLAIKKNCAVNEGNNEAIGTDTHEAADATTAADEGAAGSGDEAAPPPAAGFSPLVAPLAKWISALAPAWREFGHISIEALEEEGNGPISPLCYLVCDTGGELRGFFNMVFRYLYLIARLGTNTQAGAVQCVMPSAQCIADLKLACRDFQQAKCSDVS